MLSITKLEGLHLGEKMLRLLLVTLKKLLIGDEGNIKLSCIL